MSLKNCSSKILIYGLILIVPIQMDAQSSSGGKTMAYPFEDKSQKPYEYTPVDPDSWKEAEDKINDGDYLKVIEQGLSLSKDFGSDSDDTFEGLLAAGVSLRKMKLYYAASLVLKDIAIKKLSSELSQKALYELSLIDQEAYLDPLDFADDLLNSNEFGVLHPDVQSFVSYYASMSDLINGYREWSKKEGAQIKDQSFWAQKIIYLKGLSDVSQGKLDKAEARLAQLSADPTTSDYFKKRSNLQIARISFEKKDFIKASQIYSELKNFPNREKSRILLERAWSLFYLKNFSQALGLLQALKSPIYMVAATPERYILEMIIYKQLCYFDKVSEIAREYYKVFGPTLKNIKKRRDLKTDAVASHMAMTNMRFQEQANFINQLRVELEIAKDIDLKDFPYFKDIESKYINKDKEVQSRLHFMMASLYPQVSEEILDSEEQVKFLDYTAKLDALRIVRKGEERTYQSEKMSYMKFDQIYWPVEEEYWEEELDDYRIIIKSQCDLSMPSSSDDEKIIRQFGEEFK